MFSVDIMFSKSDLCLYLSIEIAHKNELMCGETCERIDAVILVC